MDPHLSIAGFYQRHVYLMAELARVNNEISELASKKDRLDQVIGGDASLLRVKRRKMKQSRYLTNKSLEKAQREQMILVENVHAIEAEMTAWQFAGMNRPMAQHQHTTPWVSPHLQYFPPMAYPHPETSFDAGNLARSSEPQWPSNFEYAMLQLDDASMVQDFTYPQSTQSEAESESPSSRPDSGFEEPAMYMMPFDLPIHYDASQHFYSHEYFYQPESQMRVPPTPLRGTVVPSQIFPPPVSAMPRVLEEVVSPRTIAQPQSAPLPANIGGSSGAELQQQYTVEPDQHKRRYSEDALQVIERRLCENENKEKGKHDRKHSSNKGSGNRSNWNRWSVGSSTYSATTPM